MTLELQITLPEDLAHRLEDTAAARGLSASDFAVLLIGLWTLPQMRLAESCAVRDLSDELLLHFQRRADPTGPKERTAEAQAWRIPQSLDELKPREPAPAGMTAMQFIQGKWPGDETEEELLAALKAMG